MNNVHLRFGGLTYFERTEKTNTPFSLLQPGMNGSSMITFGMHACDKH